ncbi:MAG TPA: glucose-6-phosphate isomerase [Hyphomicrobiaceae bacterium]|nr:glucose-6-phosphate isomerase [Hyphomicrobiaceae bacterium]
MSGAEAGAYTMSIEGCLAEAIGGHGLGRGTLASVLDELAPAFADLKASVGTGRMAFLDIVRARDDIAEARTALERLTRGARTLIFFGTGGSSLAGQTLAQLAGWNIPGSAVESQRGRPRTRFYDNLDPVTLERSLATLDMATCRFVLISKSGGTPETLVQAAAAVSAIRRAGLGERIGEFILGITEPAAPGSANPLRKLLSSLGAPMLEHHPGIGGRFSGLTNVGLVPAMARGLDPLAIRAGAADVIDALLAAPSPEACPPALGAAAIIGLARHRGIRTLVMMPYADRLGRFAHWWVQLWAESLGKGGHGSTAHACLGPLDQHSQLQLFMDGPRDHVVTVLRSPLAGTGPRVEADLAQAAGVDYLAGRTVGDLVAAQTSAIPEALRRAGRPVRTFDLAALDEATLGALMMHMMLETILAARLLGVDPFGQPAVELAKDLTRQALRPKA